jgi:hypothetical protein
MESFFDWTKKENSKPQGKNGGKKKIFTNVEVPVFRVFSPSVGNTLGLHPHATLY